MSAPGNFSLFLIFPQSSVFWIKISQYARHLVTLLSAIGDNLPVIIIILAQINKKVGVAHRHH